MRLFNLTRGSVVAERVEVARSFGARLRGLLGHPGLPAGEGLLIEPCTSIHTFFMSFSIDVLFLDGSWRVLRAIPGLRPWRATRIYPAAARVLELAAGGLAASGTCEGDQLEPR